MTDRNFWELVRARWGQGKFLCVGLDSEYEKLPRSAKRGSVRESIVSFNRALIDATKDIVCAFKPNPAFYEAHGDEGVAALRETIAHIRNCAPEVPVVLDAKRADIGNTNEGYAAAAFDHLRADAITVHPYLGAEALEPFLVRGEKGIFVLCRTSNNGASEFQDLDVRGRPLYQAVASAVAEKWNKSGNCGVVVGATYPEELYEVRSMVGDLPILIPGIGAQGGDLEKTVHAGKDSRDGGMLICASRAVIFASDGEDFAEAARAKAQDLHAAIRHAL